MAGLAVGGFHFDRGLRVLRDPCGADIQLRNQSLMVLDALAETPNQVVSKEYLLDTVWCDVQVTEGSLVQCISDIRRALGDDNHRLVQTVPKRGYRLVASQQEDVAKPDGTPAEAMGQEPIRFTTAADGTRIAWTALGAGPALLKAPSWISNTEMEGKSLLFGPFYARLGRRVRMILFDQRGTSLSDRHVPPLTVEAMVEDMRTVADAAGLDRFFIFGPSQGVAFAIAFAARYPERVRGIIGRGGFAQGWLVCGGDIGRAKYEASRTLIEAGWTAENPEFRRFFTARLIPDASPEISREFDIMQKRAVDAATMLDNLELMCRLDVSEEARRVTCPTLLFHSRGDRAIDVAEGARLAAMMPCAEFVCVDGDNHIVVPGSAGYDQSLSAVEDFLDRYT